MKKYVISVAIIVILAFVLIPPAVSFWVSTPSVVGFISVEKQDIWIGFYAALIGGGLTLIGVVITIFYNERVRKDDFAKREEELKIEFDKRNLETKANLAAQFKPILTVSCNSDFIHNNKVNGVREKNIICLTQDKPALKQCEKRMAIELDLDNIGRGEALNLKISSAVSCKNNCKWRTVVREHEELYVSNRLVLMLCNELMEDSWSYYDNKYLDEPMIVYVEVSYEDLVGYQHKLESVIKIHRFIHVRNEGSEIIPNVLTLNPYDTTVLNRTKQMGK